MLNFLGSDKATLIRIIVFVFAWLNQYLVSKGLQPLPVLDETAVSSIITFVVSVWTLAADNKPKQPKETK